MLWYAQQQITEGSLRLTLMALAGKHNKLLILAMIGGESFSRSVMLVTGRVSYGLHVTVILRGFMLRGI